MYYHFVLYVIYTFNLKILYQSHLRKGCMHGDGVIGVGLGLGCMHGDGVIGVGLGLGCMHGDGVIGVYSYRLNRNSTI